MTGDAFIRRIEEAEAAAASPPAPSGGLPVSEKALLKDAELPPMPATIIDGVLLEGHKMLLTGPSKAGKTWCLIALAVGVATGGWWMGFRCAKRRVLFIDLETDRRTLHRRIARVARAKGADLDEAAANLEVLPLRGKTFSIGEIVDGLLARHAPGEIGLVVVDPAYMVQDGDENNARDIRAFFAELDRLCVGLGCTVVLSHHHSKGAQGMKAAIDRGSGSGVFGRAPDAVLDMVQLMLDAGAREMAAAVKSLPEGATAWRVSFTLREFPPMPPLDVWFSFPLHVRDDTGILGDCRPRTGGPEEARRERAEAESAEKVNAVDAACGRLLDGREFCYRDELQAELGWSAPTVNRWLGMSRRYMRVSTDGSGKATVVRRGQDAEPAADAVEGVAQDELPLAP